jgi:hypothetical protein
MPSTCQSHPAPAESHLPGGHRADARVPRRHLDRRLHRPGRRRLHAAAGGGRPPAGPRRGGAGDLPGPGTPGPGHRRTQPPLRHGADGRRHLPGARRPPQPVPAPAPVRRLPFGSRSGRRGRALSGDLLGQVRALKQEDGLSIWLCGGSTLAGQLLPEIDTLLLEVSPVVLGSGLPLFAVDAPTARFAPPTVRRFADGVVVLEYRRSEPAWVLISPGRRVRSRRRARPGGRGRARRAWSAAGRRRCGPSPGRGTAPARSPRWTGPVPPARAPPAPAR